MFFLASKTPISLWQGNESIAFNPSKKFPYVPAAMGEMRALAK
jgi:hypothetical protein